MKYYILMCEIFNNISIENYNRYKISNTKINNMSDEFNSYDFLDHSEKENAEFLVQMQTNNDAAISAIVFQALAVEAYINYFCIAKIGEVRFENEYDKKHISTKEKLKKICKEVLNKNFPTDSKEYIEFIDLFNKRNKLVHYKIKGIDIKNSSDKEYYQNLNDQFLFIFEEIDNLMNVYKNLKKTLSQLDGTDIDLVELEKRKYLLL